MSDSTPKHQEPPVPQALASGKNTCGVIGLVLSIIGIILCGVWIFSIPGLIVSLIGLRKEPRKAATAGAIIGGVGTFAFLFIALIGILLPALGRARAVAQHTVSLVHIRAVQHGSDIYNAEHNSYPTSMDQLRDGSYVSPEQTQDAWKNPLRFEGGGKTKPLVTSAGADGKFDTEDDINNE